MPPTRAEVAALLRHRRGTRTQRAVADAAGIDKSAYANLENAKTGIGQVTAAKLQKVLGGDLLDYITDPRAYQRAGGDTYNPGSTLEHLKELVSLLQTDQAGLAAPATQELLSKVAKDLEATADAYLAVAEELRKRSGNEEGLGPPEPRHLLDLTPHQAS